MHLQFALTLAVYLAKFHYPDAHATIEAAAAIVAADGVQLDPNAHHAQVASAPGSSCVFPVNGACPCRAFPNRCVHRFAVALTRKMLCIHTRQWFATYDGVAGIATQTPDGAGYVFQTDANPEPMMPELARLVLAGNVTSLVQEQSKS